MSLNRASHEGCRIGRVASALLASVIAALPVGALLAAPAETAKNPPAKPATFEADIIPILKNRTCLGCHNPNLKMKELNLSSYQPALQGSESGPVIVPGKPEESRLFHMVKEGLMPPGGKIHLSDEELGTIRGWIEGGAKSAAEPHAEAALTKVTQDDVIPLMLLRCTVCHGLRRQEAGLDLRSKESMLKGGKSGPAIVLGKPDESLLIKRTRWSRRKTAASGRSSRPRPPRRQLCSMPIACAIPSMPFC